MNKITLIEDNRNSYKEYNLYKKNVNAVMWGYSVQPLLLKDLLYYAFGKTRIPKISLKKFVRQLFARYNYDELINASQSNNVVLTVLQNRPDHKEFMELISRKIDNAVIFDNSDVPLQNISIFNFRNLLVAASAFFLLATRKGFTMKERLFFTIKLSQYLHTLKKLKKDFSKQPWQVKKFVAFNGPYGQDALLSVHFKHIGVETFSIQHGIFYDYKLFIPYDIINYEFTVTDKILCWGKSSVEVLKKRGIDNRKLIIAGNPKYNSDFVFSPLKTSFQSCLLLLARFIYNEGNLNMLRVVGNVSRQLGFKVFVKAHPSLYISKEIDFSEYIGLIEKFGFILLDKDTMLTKLLDDDNFDFSISYNTGAYVESYCKGLISLRYANGENDYIEGLDDRFNDEQTLISKIGELKSSDIESLTDKVQNMVNDVLGVRNDAYRTVLNS